MTLSQLRKPSEPPIRRLKLCFCCILALLAFGCGRPATEAECNEIVVRITQLELAARGTPGADAEEVAETREALRKTTLRDCVGRRISDEAMNCVRRAKAAQQIVDECF